LSSIQVAAPSAPEVPGDRSGYRPDSSCASASADALSNVAGSAGAGRAAGRSTLKATISSGSPTSSHVPR
jgi:hypothetical protein